jgi:DNA ligase-1
VTVCLFAFDLLYLNGCSYLREPLLVRRGKLRDHFDLIPGSFIMAESMDSDSFEEIEEFLTQSVKIGCEGLMIKTLE